MKRSMFRSFVTAVVVAVGCMAGSAKADSDIFLEIDEIQGESRLVPGAMELDGFDFDMNAEMGKRKGGGMGTGKVSMQDFHFVKRIDKSSPILMKACAQGTHIKEAKLTCRKAGKEPNPYYTVKLEEVMVSSYQVGASGGSSGGNSDVPVVPMESFSLNFTKITFEYRFMGDDGQVQSIVFTYDLKMNKKA